MRAFLGALPPALAAKYYKGGPVPDLEWDEGDGPVLGDVKTLAWCRTRYWRRGNRSLSPADCRAAAVGPELEAKLARIERAEDVQAHLPAPQPGVRGPLVARLDQFGRVRGLVFGAFGGLSKDARSLLVFCAGRIADRTWRADNAASRDAAFGVTVRRLYAQWGITCARWNAITKLHGLRWAGGSDAFAHAPPRTDTAARLADREAGYYAYAEEG